MANLSPQLQAALAQFAAQPGMTPAQEVQQRPAAASNAQMLEQLNQGASR